MYRAQLLLQAGVDVNSGDNAESDNKVLHWGASFGDVHTVKLLLGNDYHFSFHWPTLLKFASVSRIYQKEKSLLKLCFDAVASLMIIIAS